jgi:hypothetical protein
MFSLGWWPKSGFRFFVTAANPGLENGGFVMESKKRIYDLLTAATYPKTLMFSPGTVPQEVIMQMEKAGLQFPVILKPDIGGKGMGVVLVHDADSLHRYVPVYDVPILLQPFIDYPMEAGIFYVRMPDEPMGKITGIVAKAFGSITGDGKSSLAALIRGNDRLFRQYHYLSQQYAHRLDEVLAPGETLTLIPFGNHARGAAFYNAKEEIDAPLTEVIDGLSKKIPGFYYGRFDIRFKDWDSLRQGKDFSIIELNGSGSEPTHIYDPSQTIAYARAEIVRHWRLLYEVAKKNMQSGVKVPTLLQGIRLLKQHRKMEAELLKLQQNLAKAAAGMGAQPEIAGTPD